MAFLLVFENEDLRKLLDEKKGLKGPNLPEDRNKWKARLKNIKSNDSFNRKADAHEYEENQLGSQKKN